MAQLICIFCGKGFKGVRSKIRPRKFCSLSCCWAWRKGQKIGFPKGMTPWNKNKKGIHLSPKNEFKKGIIPKNKCTVGTVKIKTHKREKQPRAWIKVADPNVWKMRSVFVWESHFGPVPKGLLIHHRDRNPLNDDIVNLSAMTRAAHLIEHQPELLEAKHGRVSRKRNTGRIQRMV